MGHFSSCGGKLGFPLEVWQGSQGPFALHEGVKPPLKFGEGSRDCYLGSAGRNKGPHVARTGESPDFSRVAAGGLRFLCRYPRELREPLVLPQGSQVSIRVARGSAGFLWSFDRYIRPQFTRKGQSQCVSPVVTGRLGHSSCNGNLREPLILSLSS